MSNTKCTPMQILRDNIKQKINQLEGHKQVRWIAEMETYRTVLDMIQGDSLGKPLLQQEAELLGIETEQEVEEELPYKGQICWAKSSLGKWYITHFQFKDVHLGCAVSPFNSPKEGISYCAEITTKNPYEAEEDREPKIGDLVYAWSDENPSWIGMGILTDVQLLGGIRTIYVVGEKSHWKHCSLKNPLIK